MTIQLSRDFTRTSQMMCASAGLLKQAEQIINQHNYGDEMVYIKPLLGTGSPDTFILRHKHGAMVQARVILIKQGDGYIAQFCFARDDQYDLAVAAAKYAVREMAKASVSTR